MEQTGNDDSGYGDHILAHYRERDMKIATLNASLRGFCATNPVFWDPYLKAFRSKGKLELPLTKNVESDPKEQLVVESLVGGYIYESIRSHNQKVDGLVKTATGIEGIGAMKENKVGEGLIDFFHQERTSYHYGFWVDLSIAILKGYLENFRKPTSDFCLDIHFELLTEVTPDGSSTPSVSQHCLFQPGDSILFNHRFKDITIT